MGIIGEFLSRRARSRLPEDQTKAILDRHLDGDFMVFPMADTPTSLNQIEVIAKKHGVIYPSELAAHICGHFPGMYLEVKEEIWPRAKEYDVGPFWSFLYGLHSYTSAPASDPWMRLDSAAEEFQKGSGLIAAPVLKILGDADLYCVDSRGQLVQYDHELNELQQVNLNYWQLLEREIAELCERKERKKKGT
jgi:hypothetical protein